MDCGKSLGTYAPCPYAYHVRFRYGSPYIELAETSSIVSSDFISTVEYKGKGYFSGKSHSFKATLTPSGLTSTGHHKSDKNNELHRIEGTWHTTSEYTAGPRKGKEFHNVNGAKEIVEPVGGEASGEMGEFETRKLWNLVAKGIREGDFDAASKEKTKIEVSLRIFVCAMVLIEVSDRMSKDKEGKMSRLLRRLGRRSISNMFLMTLSVRPFLAPTPASEFLPSCRPIPRQTSQPLPCHRRLLRLQRQLACVKLIAPYRQHVQRWVIVDCLTLYKRAL